MINVSSQLKKESNSRCYVTAKCVLSDGTTLNLEKEDFYNSGNGIVDSSDSSDFPLGAAIEKTATLTLVNDKDKFSTYNFNKARFTIFLNVQLSTGIETIKRGTFVVNKKPATAEKINLTLVDHMSLADKAYSTNLMFPCSAGEVLRDSCQTCGIAVGDASFQNDDFQVAEAPANTTHRAVIGFCAMLAGGNARIDENDKLRIISFNRNVSVMSSFTDGGTFSPWTEGDSVDGGTFSPWTDGDMVDGGVFGDRDDVHILNAIQDVQFDVDDVTVTGIKTTVDEVDYLYGQEGYVLNIENPLINGNIEDGLQRIGEIVVGISMWPFSLKSVANAYITFLDPVVFSDTKGHLFFSYATDVDFSFGGYTSIANTVKSLEENETEFYSGNGVVVEQAKKEMEKKLSAYDIAVRNMNQLAANTLGFYYTQVQSDDGSIIAYRHDKPNLSDSKVVYKSGIDGFFVTADYQGTDDATTAAGKWSSGFDSNGDAVLNILYAIGIQAEWINTRGFTAKDNSGNITFRVDANTGKVTIRADEFSLTGKSIEQISKDANASDISQAKGDASSALSTANNALKAAQAPEEYLTQLDIFNKLTNNGATQGIYLSGGKIYINASYINSGSLSADYITSGTMSADRIYGGTLQGAKIIGESGTIGGFTITPSKIYGGDSSIGIVGLQAPASSNSWTIWAGASSVNSIGSAPFRVSRTGKLYATDATIKGKFNSPGVEIDGSSLTIKPYFVDSNGVAIETAASPVGSLQMGESDLLDVIGRVGIHLKAPRINVSPTDSINSSYDGVSKTVKVKGSDGTTLYNLKFVKGILVNT